MKIGLFSIGAGRAAQPEILAPLARPTVCLDVISLLASGCGYNRGESESRVAQSFAAHVATQRGSAACP